ncbi:MAG TPA: M23 family metallopeptidase [Micromonosporaceae bacterium]|nr:M23 family metallopeptidase [Micromonosporaceae bacterium]
MRTPDASAAQQRFTACVAACLAALGGLILITALVCGTLVTSLAFVSLVTARPASALTTDGRPVAFAGGVPAYRAPLSAFGWPLDPPVTVLRPFAPPPQPWLAGHRGVDLASRPGARVLAAGAGMVAYAGQVAGTGVVSVEHSGGLRTTYQPVRASVRPGQVVVAGDVVGVLDAGHPGCPLAACLHWGLRVGRAYLDPLCLLGRGRIRLLPLDGG